MDDAITVKKRIQSRMLAAAVQPKAAQYLLVGCPTSLALEVCIEAGINPKIPKKIVIRMVVATVGRGPR